MKYRKTGNLVVSMSAMAFVTTTFAADPAAVLGRFDGKVLVGQNESTVPAQKGMKLSQGTRVLTSDGGWVEIVYADGCIINLPQQSMITVNGPGQCTAAKEAISKTEGFTGQKIGQVPAAGLFTIGGYTITGTALAGVGAALAAAGVITWQATDSGSTDQNSEIAAYLSAVAQKNERDRNLQEQAAWSAFCAAASPPCG